MIEFLDINHTAINDYLKENQPSLLLIITDENTHEHCLPLLLSNLETEIPFEIIELDAGEENKTFENVGIILEVFSEFQADRKALVINLGGGVITDLGGFVASIYKRGIDFINIPTSLLAMCDASIGGKTGVDLLHLKNLIGSFALPNRIFVDTHFLKTLPQKELISGFAEMLKHGLIADKKHWENLISIPIINADTISNFIQDSMLIKQNIVNQDYKEQNLRKILNFGHTIGHAVESLFLKNNNPIPHGEAVAIGMICETHLSFLENHINIETTNIIINNIKKYFPIKNLPFNSTDIFELMKNDKKNKNSKILFSLVDEIGSCKYDVVCEEANIFSAITYYQKSFTN